MIPEHLLPKDTTKNTNNLPELTKQEVFHALQKEKQRRANLLRCDFDAIILNDDAKLKIIQKTRENKLSSQLAAEYWRRVDKGREAVQYSAAEYFKKFKETANRLVGGEFIIDKENEQVIRQLCYYFSGDKRAENFGLSLSKGISLIGGVGVGKTIIMKAFSENQNASYMFVKARNISYDFADQGFKVIRKYSEIENIPLNIFGQNQLGMCIDDLGTDEEKKHFGNSLNALVEIIMNRYELNRHNMTHLTTNLNAKQTEEIYGARVRSRMREMFNQVTFDIQAKDRRK